MTIREIAASLRCELISGGERAAGAESLLLVVGYGSGPSAQARSGAPFLEVPNRVLAPGPAVELWRSVHAVRRGRIGDLGWAEDGELLAGCLRSPQKEDLVDETTRHFRRVLDLLEERGYPHLLRIWNYLPAINEGGADCERYRLFNVGRARAFAERIPDATRARYPASSAVGTPGEELRTAFLASILPAVDLENPRQVSAYQYPERYGPQPPSFSRATLTSSRLRQAFFLSGTASIVGHETCHYGSVERQLEETLRNIDSVIDRARRVSRRSIAPLAEFDLVKAYLRHPEHLERVRRGLERRLAPETPVLYLEADICRSDLLVEIEGLTVR